jgi:hypothetical protein
MFHFFNSHATSCLIFFLSCSTAYGAAFDQLTQDVVSLAKVDTQMLTAEEVSTDDATGSGNPQTSSSSKSNDKRKSKKPDRSDRESSMGHMLRRSTSQSILMSESTKLFQEEMEHFSKTLADLEQTRRVMVDQIDKMIAGPLELFYTQDVPQAKDMAKQFQRTNTSFQAAASKFSQLKKGSSNYNTAEIEWREAKRAHKKASLEYAAYLNRILPRKKMDILEKFNDLMLLQRIYFQQGRDIIASIEPRLKKLAEIIHSEHKFLDENDKKVSSIIEELSAAPDAMAVPEELDLASHPSDAESSAAPTTAAIPVGTS